MIRQQPKHEKNIKQSKIQVRARSLFYWLIYPVIPINSINEIQGYNDVIRLVDTDLTGQIKGPIGKNKTWCIYYYIQIDQKFRPQANT